jgi:hypothetical protein
VPEYVAGVQIALLHLGILAIGEWAMSHFIFICVYEYNGFIYTGILDSCVLSEVLLEKWAILISPFKAQWLL